MFRQLNSTDTRQNPTQSQRDAATTSQAVSKRKNVTSACIPCRDRKTKCDGANPCQRCVAAGVGCVQPQDLDRRTTAAIKRKFDSFEQDQQLLSDLLQSIRESSDEQVSQIISLVRSNAPLEEIRACVALQIHDLRESGREPSPELDKVRKDIKHMTSRQRQRSLSSSRRDALQIIRLIDEPPFRVPAKPWTDITDDDDLVSNLVSVWLTWDHVMYNWVDPRLFLRDMCRGQLKSSYCSPFLVNCILAWACPYSDYNEARSRKGTISQLMHDFTEEAKRLVEVELSKGLSLPLVQGVIYLYLVLALQGHDRLGYQYKIQAIDLAQKLSRMKDESRIIDDDASSDEMALAIDYTCWGIYNTITASYMALLRPQTMARPRRAKPQFHSARESDLWTAYPRASSSILCHTEDLFENLCDISTIVSPISRIIFREAGDDDNDKAPVSVTEPQVLHLYLQLRRRIADFPAHLHPIEGAPFSVLIHHLWINAQELAIVMFLNQQNNGFSSRIQQLAETRSLNLALDCARISRLLIDTISNSLMTNCVTQSLSMSLFILVEHSVNISDYTEQITDLCVCLRAVSRRWPLCMAIFRMVQLNAKRLNVKLPSETDKLFEDFETRDWKDSEVKELVSIYPAIPTMSTSDGVIDLGEFIRQMEQLEVKK